ncbi:MAG TPA: hypothetical protein VIL00_14985 [Pseudonocardiaceae bacterium]
MDLDTETELKTELLADRPLLLRLAVWGLLMIAPGVLYGLFLVTGKGLISADLGGMLYLFIVLFGTAVGLWRRPAPALRGTPGWRPALWRCRLRRIRSVLLGAEGIALPIALSEENTLALVVLTVLLVPVTMTPYLADRLLRLREKVIEGAHQSERAPQEHRRLSELRERVPKAASLQMPLGEQVLHAARLAERHDHVERPEWPENRPQRGDMARLEWYRNGALAVQGDELVFVDHRGRERRFPLVKPGDEQPEAIHCLVLAQAVNTDPGPVMIVGMFLDRVGRRVLTVPLAAFDAEQLVAVATAAGIEVRSRGLFMVPSLSGWLSAVREAQRNYPPAPTHHRVRTTDPTATVLASGAVLLTWGVAITLGLLVGSRLGNEGLGFGFGLAAALLTSFPVFVYTRRFLLPRPRS